MKMLIFLLLLAVSVNVYAEFDYHSFISEIYKIKVNNIKGKKDLDSYREKLNSLIAKTPDNPWLWLALGDLEWRYIRTLKHRDLRDSSGKITSSSPVNLVALSKQKNISFRCYEKSFYYHKNSSPKLDLKILLKLQGLTNNIDIKIDIHRTLLKEEAGIGGVFGPNNTKIEFRRGLVLSMIRAKRYDMAIAELNIIEKEFSNETNHDKWRLYFMEKIENEKRNN